MKALIVLAVIWLTAPFAGAHTGELGPRELAAIDAHALAAPADAEKSLEALALYLTGNLPSDKEKVRAIYRWVADRIEYDVESYLTGKFSKMDASQVLEKRQSVCDGFATLFAELARKAGLDVKTIVGFARGYVSQGKQRFDHPNHAWNAMKLNGEWRMIDVTWGAGYVQEGKYKKALSEAFFLAPPEQFVFSHLPQEDDWQLQRTPRLSQKDFEALPDVRTTFFNNGISALAAWETLSNPDFAGHFVQTYDLPYRLAMVHKAPLEFNLKQERSYQFHIQSATFEKMAVVQTGTWMEMPRQDNSFSLNLTRPVTGQLLVLGKLPGEENYTAILGYEVKP